MWLNTIIFDDDDFVDNINYQYVIDNFQKK